MDETELELLKLSDLSNAMRMTEEAVFGPRAEDTVFGPRESDDLEDEDFYDEEWEEAKEDHRERGRSFMETERGASRR